jgi:predicted nucleic acid-binding protein
MMRVVADASVVVKWLLPVRDDERDLEQALGLLRAVRSDTLTLYEPPHWLAEAAAVVTRLSPSTADEDISDLCAMAVKVVDSEQIYLSASRLSRELDHHLFDTLYHAVALSVDGAILVTADERYFAKATGRGRVVLLRNFPVGK